MMEQLEKCRSRIKEIMQHGHEQNAQIGDIVQLNKEQIVPLLSEDGKRIAGYQTLTTPYHEYLMLNSHTHAMLKNYVIRVIERAERENIKK